jgi:hypothetical protein
MRQKSVTGHREALDRKGWPGAIPQQVFEALEIARHITVEDRDPDTGVDGKPAVLPGEHVGCGSGVEQVRAVIASSSTRAARIARHL